MNKYVYSFTNNQVNGQQLLHIRSYELEQLGMLSIGHQEIVLEGVESLRNFVSIFFFCIGGNSQLLLRNKLDN